MVTKDGKPTPMTRNEIIQNHLKELKERILFTKNIRNMDARDTEDISNLILYQSFKWCLNKQVDELQQRKKEMEERLLSFEFNKIDDTIRLMKDKVMLGVLNMVLEMNNEL